MGVGKGKSCSVLQPRQTPALLAGQLNLQLPAQPPGMPSAACPNLLAQEEGEFWPHFPK